MTFRTVAAQTAMSKGRNICHCDLLSRQDSRKDQIKYSYFGMHDASWKSQYRSAVCIIGQKEHSSRKHRRTISNDFTSRISNGRWCQIIRIHRHTACTEDHISTLIQPVFDGLTKSAAKELASRGITVNAIAPGMIETDMTADLADKVKDEMMKQIPLKRFGQAEDVANAAAFLVSDEAAYITGQVLHVDGGMVM